MLTSSTRLQPWKNQPDRLLWLAVSPEQGVLPALWTEGVREDSHHQPGTQPKRNTSGLLSSPPAQHKLISARTIREECGLEYASIRRNPEALLLYQQHSTFLKQKRKRAKTPHPDAPMPRDPLLAYKKADLVARVRKTEELLKTREEQHATLLQDYVQKDVKIAELEAEVARHRQYLEGLRLTIQRQEHQGP